MDTKSTARLAPWLAPTILTAIFITLTLTIWWPSNFVRLSSFAIGEQFESYHAALNIERFGWQWAGVQDQATNPDPAAHPYLYIHHGNNGIYFSYLLFELGVRSLPMQNAVSILGSAGGLLLAYLCLRKLTGSIVFATLAMALLALDYELIRDWSVNIHRGLTYLSIFAAIYVFDEAARRNFRHWGWSLGALIACLNLLGTDYLYFIFTGSLIAAWTVLASESTWRVRIWRVAVTGAVFVAAFALRQSQIAYAVGWETFSKDFAFQALNRLHLEFLYPGDWAKQSAAFYATHPLLNPGFTGKGDVGLFSTDTSIALLKNVLGLNIPIEVGLVRPVRLGPNIPIEKGLVRPSTLLGIVIGAMGILDLLGRRVEAQRLSLIASIFALAVMAAGVALNSGYGSSSVIAIFIAIAVGCGLAVYLRELWPKAPAATGTDIRLPLLFGLSVLAGCISLMLLLPGYFLNWYPQWQLDSICVAIWVAVLAYPYLSSGALGECGMAALLLTAAVKTASLGSQLLPLPSPGGDHIEGLLKIRGQPTVSNFTPASVASYTHAFSALVEPEGARRLLSGGSVGSKDYRLLTERDSQTNLMYQHPKYLVFYKGLVLFPNDWSVLDEYVPIAEGNDYAIYSLPSRRR